MDPMYLSEVEAHAGEGRYAAMIQHLRGSGVPVPQIMHLFAFKPDRTEHLAEFTHGVMRGASPLAPGQRELIAAFTSRRNGCPF
jgi:alkylhydroperoxidase family enzyme